LPPLPPCVLTRVGDVAGAQLASDGELGAQQRPEITPCDIRGGGDEVVRGGRAAPVPSDPLLEDGEERRVADLVPQRLEDGGAPLVHREGEQGVDGRVVDRQRVGTGPAQVVTSGGGQAVHRGRVVLRPPQPFAVGGEAFVQ